MDDNSSHQTAAVSEAVSTRTDPQQVVSRVTAAVAARHSTNPAGTLYVTEFTVDGSFDTAQIQLSSFPALIFCQLVSLANSDKGCLITCWNSKDAFSAAKASFVTKLTVANGVIVWEGYQRLLTAQSSFPSLMKIVLCALGAVSTAWAGVTAANSFSDWIFLSPNANLLVSSATQERLSNGELNVLRKSAFRIEYLLRNENYSDESPIHTQVASVIPLENSPSDGLTDIGLSDSDSPILRAGESKSLPLIGKAVKMGLYKVGVEASCRAGWWHGWKALPPCFVNVRVWDPWSIRLKKVVSDDTRADLFFELRIGGVFAKGLNIDSKLAGMGNLKLSRAYIAETGESSPDVIEGGSGEKRRMLLPFPAARLVPMHVYTYVLHLTSSQPRTEIEWNQTASEFQKTDNLSITEIN